MSMTTLPSTWTSRAGGQPDGDCPAPRVRVRRAGDGHEHHRVDGPGRLPTSGQVSEEVATADLRAQLDDLSLRYDELSADNTSLQQAVDDLSAERDQLARSLEPLRRPLRAPGGGPPAPLRAAQGACRRRDRRPRPSSSACARWRCRPTRRTWASSWTVSARLRRPSSTGASLTHASDTEAAQAYVDSGASAFDTTMSEFRNEVLLSVANRLDGILTVIDRVR